MRQILKLFGSQRKLFLPFLVLAVIEALCVGLIWLAPHPPVDRLLAPPIRFFFGERVLHYPWHLWFLYHAMKHTHLVVSIVAGAFLTGVACVMVWQTCEGRPLSLRAALVSRQVRYGPVTLVWVASWGIGRAMMELLGRVGPKAVWMIPVGMGIAILLQALLAYAIPAVVSERCAWWKALGRSIRQCARHPFMTVGVVIIPSLLVMGFEFFTSPAQVGRWMARSIPEMVVGVIMARLAVWTVADAILTVAVARLWWLQRTPAPAPAQAQASPVSLVPPSLEEHHALA